MDALISHLQTGNDLDAAQVDTAADALLSEKILPETKAAFLKALAAKGEKATEVAAFVSAFLKHAVDPGIDPAELPGPMIDVCGTGGDRLGLFNISTATMFIAAAAGAVVVKHGNRGITSRSGGADVLEALGVPIDLEPDALRESLKRHRAGFLFAPRYHPAFKTVAPARKLLAEEGVVSIFNMLGPLLNPARPPYQLVGVFMHKLLEIYPGVFELLGRKRAWTVYGGSPEGPMDEFSTLGQNKVVVYENKASSVHVVEPAGLGFSPGLVSDLVGGNPADNAAIITGILDGTDHGPKRDIVLLNAGAALAVCGIAQNLATGIKLATETIDSKKALQCLDALRASSSNS